MFLAIFVLVTKFILHVGIVICCVYLFGGNDKPEQVSDEDSEAEVDEQEATRRTFYAPQRSHG